MVHDRVLNPHDNIHKTRTIIKVSSVKCDKDVSSSGSNSVLVQF